MVAQYPHSIEVRWKGQPIQDANGDWVEGDETTFTSMCRAEFNGEARTIVGVNGSAISYSFEVYMPRTTTVIPYGANAEIILASSHILKGSVKNQRNGQLNSQLWV